MKSRHYRIKTDYNSKGDSEFKHKQSGEYRQKRRSALSIDPQVYITRALTNINHQTKYDQLTTQQILAEKQSLRTKVKEINQMINHLLGRELFKKSSRVVSKATISRDMGMDSETLSKELLYNNHKINTLQDQLIESTNKLAGYNNVDSKIDYGRRVAETEIKIKELKEQLGRIKKNKAMRQKQILRGNSKESEQVQDLQQEYVNSSRKAQILQCRLQAVQQELADTEFSLQKQNEYYNELKVQFEVIGQIQGKLQVQSEEMQAKYGVRKRKLDLYTKRNEKEQEGKKKKYYSLLLQYQQYNNRSHNIQSKILNAQQKNQKVISELEEVLAHLKSISLLKPTRKSMQTYQQTQQVQPQTTFLTNQQRQYVSQSTQKPHSPLNNNKSIIQNQLNKPNANRSFIRKWNLQGSIVRQKINPNSSQVNMMEEVQSDQQGQNRISYQLATKESKRSRAKQIQHFKTEASNAESFIRNSMGQQELYQSDFQS